MQSTVGHWLAIGFLGLLAAYSLGMYINQQTDFEFNKQKTRTATVTELANELKNEHVSKLILANAESKEVIKKIKDSLDERNEKIENLASELAETKERISKISTDRENAMAALESAKDTERKLNERITHIESIKDEDLKQEIARLTTQTQEYMTIAEQRLRKISSLQTNAAALEGSAYNRITALQRDKAMLQESSRKRTDAIQSRAMSQKSNGADGEILAANLRDKFVVVNLGKSESIHRGMRFDVVRWAQNRWKKVAAIEIFKVGPSTSQAIILNEPRVKKICPYTGYIAKDSEERYSPYASTGDDGRAVPLVSISNDDHSTMKETDPIVVGDAISNPFYDPEKKLRFAFAGEPVVYSMDILKNKIKEAGGILQDEAGLDTDFIVIGKAPLSDSKVISADGEIEEIKEDSNNALSDTFKKYNSAVNISKQYGVPVMREVELYEFLRN